jgi:hypothetical protein
MQDCAAIYDYIDFINIVTKFSCTILYYCYTEYQIRKSVEVLEQEGLI